MRIAPIKTAMSIPTALAQHDSSPTITGRWRLDRQRSRVEFRAGHLWGLRTVNGSFDDYRAQLDLRANPAIELAIEAASVQTGNRRRDQHLMLGRFL